MNSKLVFALTLPAALAASVALGGTALAQTPARNLGVAIMGATVSHQGAVIPTSAQAWSRRERPQSASMRSNSFAASMAARPPCRLCFRPRSPRLAGCKTKMATKRWRRCGPTIPPVHLPTAASRSSGSVRDDGLQPVGWAKRSVPTVQ